MTGSPMPPPCSADAPPMVDAAGWHAAGAALASGERVLVALWAARDDAGARVHLATRRPNGSDLAVIALRAEDGSYPSIGRYHPGAILMERALQDASGLRAEGLPDPRPWLDHERDFAFLPAEGEGLHRIPVGPIHAGTIEPGHFRFTVNGETIVRLEARLGYTHKGTLGLMRGATPDAASRLAGRVSGDSTVAYAWAFARAVEAALGVVVPKRASVLRGVMAELERLANHAGDFGAICNDAGFPLINAHAGALRETILRQAEACFGHRLMMDRIVPGGVAADLVPASAASLLAELPSWRGRFERLVELYGKTASLQDRVVAAGRLAPDLAHRLGCGGYVGRAAGQDFDARRDAPYPPYDRHAPDVPALAAGDVDARVRIRIAEIRASVALIGELLGDLPEGDIRASLPEGGGEAFGCALVEGFRGDVFAAVRLRGAVVADAFLRDPSWFFWPALEAAIEGNIVADFPLCNKSFNAAYSGCDL
ncbi:NADH-quinone oxidoreductase subunit C [Acidiphilium sp.]|uniref:hydrogenase large subunit n=1 Tax=Acidiphilium sp. TaxID=527 RepID=UPI00258BAC29|nr:NADH-quinone oxidoreductase subunit C [Acidiphilium sp.]